MKSAYMIAQRFKEVDSAGPEEKLPLLYSIRADIRKVEFAAAQDFSFPLTEIMSIKELIPKVMGRIGLIMAQRKIAKRA